MSSKLSSTSNGTFHSWPANVSRSCPQRRVRKWISAPSSGNRRGVVPDLRLVVVGLHQDGDLLALEAHCAPVRRDGRAVEAVGRLDEVGAALGDHHDPGVAVARRDGRHHARVGDPQALDAVDAQLGIDDRELVEAHLAGAGLVVVRVGLAP